MKRDLAKILAALHRLGIDVGIENTAPSGGFAVWIGSRAAPRARKLFGVNQLDQIADWLVVTAQGLNEANMSKALREL